MSHRPFTHKSGSARRTYWEPAALKTPQASCRMRLGWATYPKTLPQLTPEGFQPLAGGRAQRHHRLSLKQETTPKGSQKPMLYTSLRPLWGRLPGAAVPAVSLRETAG